MLVGPQGTPFNPLADENLGAMVIGLALSLVLFGVVIIQSYAYFQRFGDDRAFIKYLASIVLVLEAMQTFTITHTIYRTSVTLNGIRTNGPNSYPLTTSVVLEVLITALVQGFFAFRIFRLSRTLWICSICWVLGLLRLGGGLALAAESYCDVPREPNATVLTETFAWLITLSLVVGAFVDVLIAASLCFYLKRMVTPQPSKSTSQLVDGLIGWTVQTGMITSVASVSVVIAFYAWDHAEIWFAIYMVTAKLYSNSFFVSLNLRRRRREVVSATISNLHFQTTPHMDVQISTSTHAPGLHSIHNDHLWKSSTPPNTPPGLKPGQRVISSIDLEAREFPSPPGIAVVPCVRY